MDGQLVLLQHLADRIEIVGVEQFEADRLIGGIAFEQRQRVIARIAAHANLVAAEISGLAFARRELQSDDVGQIADRGIEIGGAEPQIADILQIDHRPSFRPTAPPEAGSVCPVPRVLAIEP